MPAPNMYAAVPAHGYASTTSMESHPLYTSYDTQMVTSAPNYPVPTPSSSGVPMGLTGYSYGSDVQFTENNLPVHPAPSAPPPHLNATQSLPTTPMSGLRYQYPASYNESWDRTRPG